MNNSIIKTILISLISLSISVILTFLLLSVILKIEFSWSYYIFTFIFIFIIGSIFLANLFYIYPINTHYNQEDFQKYPMYFYYDYINGFARVAKTEINKTTGNIDTLFNFVDIDGNLISDKWWTAATDFEIKGCAAVMNEEGLYNLIGEDGKLKSIMWFPIMTKFSNDGLAKVIWKDSTVNFINTDGKLIWKEWKEESNQLLNDLNLK